MWGLHYAHYTDKCHFDRVLFISESKELLIQEYKEIENEWDYGYPPRLVLEEEDMDCDGIFFFIAGVPVLK